MKRFMGMMPSNEIAISKQFKVGVGQFTVTIQAGKNGWTIIYADSSTEYKNIVDTPENNLNAAMIVLKTHFNDINEIKR